jgi:hypothetical protein
MQEAVKAPEPIFVELSIGLQSQEDHTSARCATADLRRNAVRTD